MMKRTLPAGALLTVGLIGEVVAWVVGSLEGHTFVGSAIALVALIALIGAVGGYIRQRHEPSPGFTQRPIWRLFKVIYVIAAVVAVVAVLNGQSSNDFCYAFNANTGWFDYSQPNERCLADVRNSALSSAGATASGTVLLYLALRAVTAYVVGNTKPSRESVNDRNKRAADTTDTPPMRAVERFRDGESEPEIPEYGVYKDHKYQCGGTEQECYQWLQKHTRYSVDHAMKQDGWVIKRVATADEMAQEVLDALNRSTAEEAEEETGGKKKLGKG